MKLRSLLSALIAVSSVSAYANELVVEIPSDGITLQYPQSVRLEQVLSDAIQHSKSSDLLSFPLNKQLFDITKENEANQLKTSVLEELSDLSQKKKKLRTSIELVINQIKRWDVGYRVQVSLDYDLIRLALEKNPRLSGKFELLLPSREEAFTVEGLVFSPQKIKLNQASSASEYLSQVNKLSSAHKSEAWIIYSDGHFIRSGYAYWNKEPTQLTPGSVVFFGFDSDDKDIRELEHKIVKLISMRKGL
ncbi:capsule biosynthesis GfcC family protein [Vibrio japonicus]|uniref:Capsule biosynthesis GfcC family protein n=1 Tax=Vibrio japonicus TaxID=1824638 RepID=A0ABY5LF11_9VIBR|nr:capsule biosynthesis GfcC family protein [Vibrio japonicus]UUM30041.1 capsule biosynthesis GfcC family protein [Vibrio japonicus]